MELHKKFRKVFKVDIENKDTYLPKFIASATELNRGKASSLIKKVHDTNENLLIIKNSKPYAVVISYDKYNEISKLLEGKEDE